MPYQQSWKDKIAKRPLHSGGTLENRLHKKKPWLIKFFFNKTSFKILLFLVLAGFILAAAGFSWLSRDLPNPNQLMERQIAQSTKIYDRTGQNVLYDIHGDQQRTLVELKDIPNYLKWATIAVEDKNFYTHKGFSLWAIFRTIVSNVLYHQKAGGSTLTQQFIKNAILSSEKTYTRKLKELILAYKMEKKFTKDQILQMYLNEIPYGSTAYGIQAASQRYFKKNVQGITLAEAAVLAALPQSPTVYSPYGSHKDALMKRQRMILDLMVEQGYVTKDEAEAAKNQELTFAPNMENITAPHFVMYIKEILTERYGEKMVEQGGLKIYTTLDLYKQKLAEKTINDWWERTKVVDKKTGEESVYNNFGASNAALVSIDPKTGQVLAMAGSRDYFNNEIDGQFNVATARRQPGLSLKPLVYATLFTKGYTPTTILYDVVTNFSSDPKNPYEPKNFNLKEYGPVTIRQALAGSLNIPAVKATYLAGLDSIIELAKKFGYTSLEDKDRFGLSLALGGAEVELLEHTNAYGVFAREGLYHPVAAILKVEDKDGKILEEWKLSEENVLDQNIAREINDILSDNNARAYMFGERNNLTLPNRPVAAKTGTTNEYHDAWTMGYTPSLVTGIWVGNSDNKAMTKGTSAANAAGPLWHEFMLAVLGDTPVENFNKPEIPVTGKPVIDGVIGGQTVKVDKATGFLATEYTPPEMVEEKTFNENHCILYYVNPADPLGPPPTDPTADPQFNAWESRVLEWAQKQAASSSAIFSTSSAPTQADNVHTPQNKPTIKIISPANNVIVMNKFLSTNVQAEAPRGIASVKYYINDNLFAEKGGHFFNLENQPISFLPNGYHNLKATACDDVGNCSSASIEFNYVGGEENINTNFTAALTWPSNGLALGEKDLPTNLKFELTNYSQVARIDVFAQKDGVDSLLGTINMIGGNDVAYTWNGPRESGLYTIHGKAYSWKGEMKKTNEALTIITRGTAAPKQ
jgi:1A family penicillin-binding protein